MGKLNVTCNNQTLPAGRKSNELVARKKKYNAVLLALFCFTSLIFPFCGRTQGVAPEPAASQGSHAGPVKWHPGHYYMLAGNGKSEPGYMKQVYAELQATPALLGLQVRYSWRELEPVKGNYDFTSVDKLLAELAAQKKRLVILLQIKSFDADPAYSPVPEYAKGAAYSGGIFAFSNVNKTVIRGYGTKLWNQNIYDRMVALVEKLGQRYNSNPYFEGIGFSESAFGQPYPKNSILLADSVKFYDNVIGLNRQLRTSFPNTMTYQFTNYPRNVLEKFVSNFKELGIALGGPDIFMTDKGLQTTAPPKGIYHYYPELSGIVPLAPSIQHQNFRNTQHDGKGYQPTLPQLLSFAKDTLKANYLFWTRDQDFYPQVLELLNAPAQRDKPAGGLDPNCPSAYSSCNTE